MSNFKIFAILATVTTASTVLVEHLPLETYGRRSAAEVALFAPVDPDEVVGEAMESGNAWTAIGSGVNNDTIDASMLMDELFRGNERFVAGAARSTPGPASEANVAPHTVVVGCADCPLASDDIFDAQPGSMFDIRVAGNLLSPAVIESIDYATNRMGIKLVVVVGHQRCGVIRDLVAPSGDEESLARQALLMRAAPVVEDENQTTDGVARNVSWAVRHLAELPQFRRQVADGELKIIGSILDESTGRVTLCD
ncbi:MAG: carbonic anhydrase [Planctomycetota bacterium]